MKTIKTICDFCGHTGCTLKIIVDSNKIVKVEGDKDDPRTGGKLCPQGLAAADIIHSKERLTHPLVKTGENEWMEVSWDEALTQIAKKLSTLKEESGGRSIAIASGYARSYVSNARRRYNKLAALIGTSNLAAMDHTCARPRRLGVSYVFGPIDPWNSADLKNSNCLVLWGINPIHDPPRIKTYNKAIEEGKTLIAVDPRATPYAKKAVLHLQLRPGTDGALALGMMNVIIGKGLYNEDFMEKWTIGFPQLRELVKNYIPEKVSEITWLNKNDVVKAAELYANRGPSSIDLGNALDQHTNNFQTIRAIASLIALTGNVDVPGGNLPQYNPPARRNMPREAVGQESFPLADNAHIPSYWKSILTGTPYKIRGMIIYSSNLAVTDCDAQLVAEALTKIEFLVVIDLFMTETARYADVVLPAASFLETELYKGGEKAVDPPGEAWPDEKIVVELAGRMGFDKKLFEEPDAPRRVSEVKYRRYLERGFPTSSGKIEFYSKELEELGLNPLPDYIEPRESPSNPDLSSQYPLILTTGAKLPMFTHSQFRNIPKLNGLFPENYFTMNPKTAAKYDVKDGEVITVESPTGRLTGRFRTTLDLLENVVQVYHGFSKMNSNMLTSSSFFDPGTGSPGLKSSLCRIVPTPNP